MLHSLTEKEHNTYRRLRNLKEIIRFNNPRTLPSDVLHVNGTKKLLFERSRFPISEKSHAIKNHSALSIQLVLLILFDLREMRFKKCHLH